MKKHHLRLRWLPGVLIFLLLGAILNVAVAWGCCLWGDPWDPSIRTNAKRGYLRIGFEKVYYQQVETPLYLLSSGVWTDSFLSRDSVFDALIRGDSFSEEVVRWSELWEPPEPQNELSFTTVGWPAYSMWFEPVITTTSGHISGNYWTYNYGTRHGLILNQLPSWGTVYPMPRTVPLGIHYRGFLINSIFYSVILWLPYQGFFTLRRHRRIRRGRCGQCGYLVAPNIGVPGASPNCPECGTTIHPAPRIGNPDIIKPKV